MRRVIRPKQRFHSHGRVLSLLLLRAAARSVVSVMSMRIVRQRKSNQSLLTRARFKDKGSLTELTACLTLCAILHGTLSNASPVDSSSGLSVSHRSIDSAIHTDASSNTLLFRAIPIENSRFPLRTIVTPDPLFPHEFGLRNVVRQYQTAEGLPVTGVWDLASSA